MAGPAFSAAIGEHDCGSTVQRTCEVPSGEGGGVAAREEGSLTSLGRCALDGAEGATGEVAPGPALAPGPAMETVEDEKEEVQFRRIRSGSPG
jgi:hypothetical protein